MRFLVYISIFCTTDHSTVFQDLLKYIHSIWLGAKWCALGWKSYDEKFRLRMSQDPAGSWAVVDPDLWLLICILHLVLVMAIRMGSLKCFAFNYQGLCGVHSCAYTHSCLSCFEEHPLMIQCPIQDCFPEGRQKCKI